MIEIQKFAIKVFNSEKYLVTFLLIHLLTNSVACCWRRRDDVTVVVWTSKQIMVFNQENKVLIKVLQQE